MKKRKTFISIILLFIICLFSVVLIKSKVNLKAGELPNSKIVLTYNDISKYILNDGNTKDALSLKLESNKIEYKRVYVEYDKYDFNSGQYIDKEYNSNLSLYDLDLSLDVNNLKNASYVSELNAYLYLNTKDENNNNLECEAYLQSNNNYIDLVLNDILVNLINDEGFNVQKEMKLNKSIINFSLKDNTPLEIKNSIYESMFNNFIDIRIYNFHIVLTINIDKNNIFDQYESFINDLYHKGILDYYLGYEINDDDFISLKEDILEDIKFFADENSYFKLSCIIGVSNIRTLIDFEISIYEEEKYINNLGKEKYIYSDTSKISADFDINIKIKNNIKIKTK